MAASLCKMNKWRTLKTCLSSAHWASIGGAEQLTCSVRHICTSHVLRAKSSDVHWQQQAVETSIAEPDTTTPDLVKDPMSIAQAALQHEDYFNVKELVTLRDLFKAKVHLGHNAGLRHESMIPYIFGERIGVDIIDLEKTLPMLHEALNVCAHIVYRGGMVLFLSRNMQVLPWVERMATDVGEYAHCRPWKSGIFTNSSSNIFPELCVFFNTQDTVFETHQAVIEANKLLIPTIGVADTNCDCQYLTYCIPGNDDTPVSQHLMINLFKETLLRAKKKRKEDGMESGVQLSEDS